MTRMNTPLITIKATKQAWQWLRLIAAHTGEKQYAVLERLVQRELQRVEKRRAETWR